MTNILIPGGSGLVGKRLCDRLNERGYEVAILSRSKNRNSAVRLYHWDPDQMKIEREAIERADCVIHLAGANIAERKWTARRKRRIVDSRVKTGELIFREVKILNKDLQAFITASAVGYYGAVTSDRIFTESDPPCNDFLGETCVRWEQMAGNFSEPGIRTVKIRTGVVLAGQGGALAKMMAPVKMGIGSAIGTGRQFMPWIHIDDLCGIYIKAIEDKKMTGAYNAVAPDHQTNKAFMQTLARVLNKPFWAPNVPAPAMRLIFGKMSEILLKGSRVSPRRIEEAGYHFRFPELEPALNDLLLKHGRPIGN